MAGWRGAANRDPLVSRLVTARRRILRRILADHAHARVRSSAGCGRTGVFILVTTVLEKMRKERAAAQQAMSAQSLRTAVEVVDQMEIDSPIGTTTAGAGRADTPGAPSTNPFEFPDAAGTTHANTLTQAAAPAFPLFARMNSTTPSSLIPQTASLSLAPESRGFHAASPSPPITEPFMPTSLPIDSRGVNNEQQQHVAALDCADPIFAGTNSMRECRMSMVANYRQYVAVHEAVLVGAMQEIEGELEEMRRQMGVQG